MQRFNWRALWLALSVLAFLGLLTIPQLGISETVASAPTQSRANVPPLESGAPRPDRPGTAVPLPDPEASCARNGVPAHYYFFPVNGEVKETPGAFGSSIDSPQVSVVNDAVKHRLCGDAKVGGDMAFWRALDGTVYGIDPNRPVTDVQWRQEARNMVRSIDWTKSYFDTEAPTKQGTRTLYMSDKNNDGIPEVGATTLRQRDESRFLVLTINTGVTQVKVKIRLKCGGQPVFEPGQAPAVFA